MNKEELRYRVQEGFFDLAPDMFDKIVEATEQPVENVVFNISDKKKSDHFYNTLEFKMLSRVAMLVLVIGLGIGIFGLQRNQEVYIVAMDVNPSIQLELNKEYKVRKITGLNEDGVNIVKKLEWKKNNSVSDTLNIITDKLVSEGYLGEDGGILITLHQKDENQDYEELKSILNQELENDVSKYGVNGVAVAFQTVEEETELTGKELLKERMIKEYNLDNAEVDEMNIRDMFDYIEEDNGFQTQILEKVTNQSVEGTTQESNSQTKMTIKKDKGKTTEQISSQEQVIQNKKEKTTSESKDSEKSSNKKNVTTSENKNKKEKENREKRNNWEPPSRTTREDNENSPTQTTREDNGNSSTQTTRENNWNSPIQTTQEENWAPPVWNPPEKPENNPNEEPHDDNKEPR